MTSRSIACGGPAVNDGLPSRTSSTQVRRRALQLWLAPRCNYYRQVLTLMTSVTHQRVANQRPRAARIASSAFARGTPPFLCLSPWASLLSWFLLLLLRWPASWCHEPPPRVPLYLGTCSTACNPSYSWHSTVSTGTTCTHTTTHTTPIHSLLSVSTVHMLHTLLHSPHAKPFTPSHPLIHHIHPH